MSEKEKRIAQRNEKAAEWKAEMADLGEFPNVGRELFDQHDPFSEEDYILQVSAYLHNDIETLKKGICVDVGSGFGSKLHDAVVKLGIPLRNLDVSFEAVSHRKKHGEAGVVADAFRLPFADASIDVIVSANFINAHTFGDAIDMEEYYRNLEDFVVEVARVLRPGGAFVQSNFGAMTGMRGMTYTILRSAGFDHPGKILPVTDPEKSARIAKSNLERWVEPFAFVARKSATAP